MAIFVFISGYGIAASYRQVFQNKKADVKEIVSFTWKRLWKLEMFYWFAFILTLVCQPLGRTIFEAYGTDFKSIIVYFFIDFFGLSYLFWNAYFKSHMVVYDTCYSYCSACAICYEANRKNGNISCSYCRNWCSFFLKCI